jgi:CRP-like cAMP-binding protein
MNSRDEKELMKFLKKVSIFKDQNKNDLKHLRTFFHFLNFKAGETVFEKGFPNVMFYIVKEGELLIYLPAKEGDIELNHVKPTGHIGANGLFTKASRTASVKALEDSVLLGISRKDLEAFVNKYPRAGNKVLFHLGEELCANISRLNERLENQQDGKI